MGAQYVVDENGKRASVILPVEEYERMVEELEDFEDILAVQAYDRAKAEIENDEDEAIPWEQVREKVGSEYEEQDWLTGSSSSAQRKSLCGGVSRLNTRNE